jgi:hypothetical protein
MGLVVGFFVRVRVRRCGGGSRTPEAQAREKCSPAHQKTVIETVIRSNETVILLQRNRDSGEEP